MLSDLPEKSLRWRVMFSASENLRERTQRTIHFALQVSKRYAIQTP